MVAAIVAADPVRCGTAIAELGRSAEDLFDATNNQPFTMKTRAKLTSVLMILMSFASANAPAALVAVEFGGRVTGGDLGHRRGTRVSGYFIYEPGVASGTQTATPPNLVVEMTDTTYFERSAYNFYVYNNWLRESDFVSLDGFALEFSYPGGYGSLSLMSSNTSLFTNNLAPVTIPALNQFDAGRSMTLTVDIEQPYRSTVIEIDDISVVPVVRGYPVIFGLGRRAGGISFRFMAEASKGYTVQVSDNLAAANWTTLTNVARSIEHMVLINDLALRFDRSGNRFYRVRRD